MLPTPRVHAHVLRCFDAGIARAKPAPLARCKEEVSRSDLSFFARNPDRSYRLRRAQRGETILGRPVDQPLVACYCTKHGDVIRRPVPPPVLPFDLDHLVANAGEEACRSLFEHAATETTT